MGGGSKDTEKQSQALEQQQVALGQQQAQQGQQWLDFSKQRIARSDVLQQPLVDFYSGIAKGGPQTLTAAAPLIGQIDSAAKQTQENIYNTVPAGAARDVAMAQQEISKGQQIGGTLNNTYQTALQQLGALGTGQAQLGLQEAGAGFTGTGQAGTLFGQGQSALQNIMTAQNQRKSSTMGFFGSLVGAAGMAAGGGAFGALGALGGGSKGGGGGGGSYGVANPSYGGYPAGTA